MERAGLFPFFRQLSPRGRGEIDALRTTAVDPNAPLLRRGDDAGGAYLVLEGALRVYYLTEEGREATLYRVEPGGTCVLALSSTLSARPYPAWVE
ncbi:MAG: cyclic nucleotide-binding domain-containing protein, partial [Myxococcota bacterium]